MIQTNPYYDLKRSKEYVLDGRHRECVGGLWEELGKLPMEFLLERGLSKNNKVIDIGCGCLRVGVHLVDFLEAGNYFGTDISEDLLRVGYEIELKKAGLMNKQPYDNLIRDDGFNFSLFNNKFDIALAQSLFTHLPINYLKLCLCNLYEVMSIGSELYATFFLASSIDEWSRSLLHQPGGIVTFPCRDPYHYTIEDLDSLAGALGWEVSLIGDWGHPRDQKMVLFTKISRHKYKLGGMPGYEKGPQ